ncbi:hypothetical protein [Desulfovirgula thermocuniculi]|uniref:hypothetical protein n=1 Tax=Desulfovirgula thermocuniculi TaxID=348842 RepID=UPI000424D9F3|nr:hypothetical protein [Desulfovirgula thermocuniculi]
MAALPEIKKKLQEVFPEKQAQVLLELVDLANELVKAGDFAELKQVVKELAEAQKRTEQRIEELAEAQKRTEQRLEELAEAQKRTEERVGGLERALQELAEAQKRTEEELQKLAAEHAETRRQLGGLAMTVGYTLENEAYKALPALLQQDYGLVVEGRLKRAHVLLGNGDYLEVNILGDGTLGGRRVKVVGESKTQLSQDDVDRFLRRKLGKLRGVFPEVFPVLVTHMTTSPEVEEYAKKKGIAVYYSYEF